jgi:hypothetical protein
MEKEIRINLAWQSDEQVAKIIVSAGKGQVVIYTVDNERNESGYSGEVDIVIPAYLYNISGERSMYVNQQSSSAFQQNSMEMYANSGSPSNEAVQYTVQLVDEVNQRSTLLKDNVRRTDLSHSNTVGQKPQAISTSGAVIVNVKEVLNSAVNSTIGLLAKNGTAPTSWSTMPASNTRPRSRSFRPGSGTPSSPSTSPLRSIPSIMPCRT